MQPFTIGSKTVSIFPSIEPEAPITYLNTFSDEGQKVYGATQPDGCPPFTLVAISDLDWNHDMVPWDSPPVFRNAESCTGGADDYLRHLTTEIIPTAEKELELEKANALKANAKPGSMAAKANLVREFNERNNKKN